MKKSLYVSVFSISLLFFFCNRIVQAQPAETNSNTVNKPKNLPDFSLKDTEGNTISLADYKGKYLVLHIATTWCPFCNAEAPNLEKLYKDYRDKNVDVLIIDVKEDKKLVEELLVKRFNLSFPVLLDVTGEVAARMAPADVLPDLSRDEVMLASNLLINPEGKILFFSLLDSKNFDAKLEALKKVLDEQL